MRKLKTTPPEGVKVPGQKEPLKPLTQITAGPMDMKALGALLREKIRQQRKARPHGNIKCNCGHTAKDHHNGEGWCHSKGHPKEGQCGCTWYYPNDKWILKNRRNEKDTV
jgi:hypothetical protein